MKIRRALKVIVSAAAAFAAAELAARLQQRLGPFIDLDMASAKTLALSQSDVVHHRPLAEERFRTSGLGEYVARYDEDGVRIVAGRPDCSRAADRVRILFLGDSFMQGYDDAHTIPAGVARAFEAARLPACAELSNAGFFSYAPAIYAVQARLLLPKLKPRLVVVDIDETDLMDDTFRYRDLIRRDASGRITGVRASPAKVAYYDGFIRIRRQPSYAVRLFLKLYHTRIRTRRLEAKARPTRDCYDAVLPLSVARYRGGDVEERFKDEIALFEANLDEVARTCSGALGAGSVLFTFHPHYGHLRPVDGRLHNRTVADVTARVCRRNGIRFFDATADLKTIFEPDPASHYFWPEDAYSHFKPEATVLYGELIGRELVVMMSTGE